MRLKELFISQVALAQAKRPGDPQRLIREILDTVSRERPVALHYYNGREPHEAPEVLTRSSVSEEPKA